MRFCPSCNQPTTRIENADARTAYICSSCGWGQEQLQDRLNHGSQNTERKRPNPALVLLGLAFSTAFIVGPYLAMLHYIQPIEKWMQPTYWAVMATYLMAATVLEPTPDTSDLGLFGTMIDNPLSFEDDHNRYLLGLKLFLLPGKCVAWTVGSFFRLLKP